MADGETNGSIDAPDEGDEGQVEAFPMGTLEGDAKTLKTLTKAGQRIETTVSLRSAEVPSSGGGLLDPERERMVLVTCAFDKLETVPVREDGRVVAWKHRQVIRPIYVEAVNGEAGAVEAAFAALLAEDERAAGALLDRLRERVGGVLTPA